MIGQVSDSELELMKIIWAEGGKTLYSRVMDALAETGKHWQKNTVITLLSRLLEKGLVSTLIQRELSQIAVNPCPFSLQASIQEPD